MNATSSLLPVVSRGAMTMILADTALNHATLPLARIAVALAETVRAQLRDLTWVLHVVWDDDLPPRPTSPPTYIGVPRGAGLQVTVHDQLAAFCRDWGIAFDHVFIETSAVNPDGSRNAELWHAMDGLECTASVHYLFDDPKIWSDLPLTLGLLPTGVHQQPVALLGPMPPAQFVRGLLSELLDIIGSVSPSDQLRMWFRDTLETRRVRGLLKHRAAVVSQIYGSTRHKPEAWPLDAIRLRFSGDPSVARSMAENTQASFGRWARAATARRVAVALGGAGAQSYVSIPFLQRLDRAGVPIDILSGTSTGACIAVFYAALGDEGLLRMLIGANTIGAGVLFGVADNTPLTWWMSWATGFADLSDLAQPTVTVSTVAQTGEPYYQTSGLAGKALAASAALPPFSATYIGNTRLVDGGPTQVLPTAITSAAGADLILATQPIPKIESIPRIPESVRVPYLLKWATGLNPVVRSFDGIRAVITLFRQASLAQRHYAQVTYNATTRRSTAASWYAGRRIARQAGNSEALKDAVDAAKVHWRILLDGAPGRVRINRDTLEVEIGPAVEIGFERAPSGALRLSGDAERVVMAVGAYVRRGFASAIRVELIHVSTLAASDYRPLFEAAAGLGREQIIYIKADAAPPRDPTFALTIVP